MLDVPIVEELAAEGQGRTPDDCERTVWIAIGVHEQLQVYLREARKRLGRIVRRMYLFS
jgi:hypothetical protein